MCFAPVSIRGRVFNIGNSTGIEGARVVAIDTNGSAASGVGVSDATGAYTLRIPAARNSDGTVQSIAQYTLRADAQNFQTFPSGIRVAIPIDTSTRMMMNNATFVQNATTDIGLFALAPDARGTIAGRVDATFPQRAGVLVTATAGMATATAISGTDGTFVVFNAPVGANTVSGYASGLQLTPAMATVTAGPRTENVVLSMATTATGSVSGSINIVNGGGGGSTSVVLVVASTFNAVTERGEVPRGLRANDVTGAFRIEGVPDGDYVILPGFGNDGLVRDPDVNIGGTAILRVTVPTAGSRDVALAGSFKVTGALNNPSPGRDAPEAVMGTPTFQWDDDSSEDGYSVVVYDAFGTVRWMTDLPSVSGARPSAMYAGPALEAGMYYQFRATSWRTGRMGRTNISRTEELRGVFFVPRP